MVKKSFACLFTARQVTFGMIEVVETRRRPIDEVDVRRHPHQDVIIRINDVAEAVVTEIGTEIVAVGTTIVVVIRLRRETTDVDNRRRHRADVLVVRAVVMHRNHRRKKNDDIHDQVQVNRNRTNRILFCFLLSLYVC